MWASAKTNKNVELRAIQNNIMVNIIKVIKYIKCSQNHFGMMAKLKFKIVASNK